MASLALIVSEDLVATQMLGSDEGWLIKMTFTSALGHAPNTPPLTPETSTSPGPWMVNCEMAAREGISLDQFSLTGFVTNKGARVFRIESVFDVNGNFFPHRRLHGGRKNYFGTKMRQLHSFAIT